MPFVPTCDDLHLDVEILRSEEGCAVVVHLGHDTITGADFYCHLGLSVMAGGNLEMYFFIREFHLTSSKSKEYWSGRDLPVSIDQGARRSILDVVCAAIRIMLKTVRPVEIFWQTYDPKPPDKALVKYERIAYEVRQAGYTVTKADEHLGKVAWWAERS